MTYISIVLLFGPSYIWTYILRHTRPQLMIKGKKEKQSLFIMKKSNYNYFCPFSLEIIFSRTEKELVHYDFAINSII
jgi:hypothetical protein